MALASAMVVSSQVSRVSQSRTRRVQARHKTGIGKGRQGRERVIVSWSGSRSPWEVLEAVVPATYATPLESMAMPSPLSPQLSRCQGQKTTTASQIGGIDEGRASRVKFGDKGITVVGFRLVGLNRIHRGKIGRPSAARHIGVAGGIDGDPKSFVTARRNGRVRNTLPPKKVE